MDPLNRAEEPGVTPMVDEVFCPPVEGAFVQKVLDKIYRRPIIRAMPRLGRLDTPGVLPHGMGRGIEKRKIFLAGRERSDFISRLAALGQEKWMDIYAWAFRPNHFRFLCRTRENPLATSMCKLMTGACPPSLLERFEGESRQGGEDLG